jgi:hypothetical protein
VISYQLYCQIQLYYKERGLSFAQIGRELNLDEETVAKWARQKTYCQRLAARSPGGLRQRLPADQPEKPRRIHRAADLQCVKLCQDRKHFHPSLISESFLPLTTDTDNRQLTDKFSQCLGNRRVGSQLAIEPNSLNPKTRN